MPHCLVFLCASILCVDVQSHVSDIGQLESANDIDNNSLLHPQIKAGQPSNTHGKQHKLVREYSMLCVQVTQTDLLHNSSQRLLSINNALNFVNLSLTLIIIVAVILRYSSDCQSTSPVNHITMEDTQS